jgi:hypothetical protein
MEHSLQPGAYKRPKESRIEKQQSYLLKKQVFECFTRIPPLRGGTGRASLAWSPHFRMTFSGGAGVSAR